MLNNINYPTSLFSSNLKFAGMMEEGKRLRAYGENVVVFQDGRTAIDLAREYNMGDVVAYLEAALLREQVSRIRLRFIVLYLS